MTVSDLVIPLVPRRRLVGLSFGATHSARRGMGADVAGSRPYQPGDDMDTIDWSASARVSSARASDEFVVRERYAEVVPHVVAVCDRRPEMAQYRPHLPWLSKPAAMHHAVELILDSTDHARGLAGYLDFATGEAFWQPPRSDRRLWQTPDPHLLTPAFFAPADTIARALRYLAEHRRSLPTGSFVFVLSDFIAPLPDECLLEAVEHGWDIVPVVIQDPLWEQSFPDVAGVVVPLVDPRTGRVADVRLRAAEAARQREANERRLATLLARFRSLDLEPILVSSAEPATIHAAFLDWTEQRHYLRGRPW